MGIHGRHYRRQCAGDLILEHAEELAQLESLTNGKPVAVALDADVPLAADLFHYMAGWATKIEGNTINISVPYMPGANFHSYTLREPLGVVGQIIPAGSRVRRAGRRRGPLGQAVDVEVDQHPELHVVVPLGEVRGHGGDVGELVRRQRGQVAADGAG